MGAAKTKDVLNWNTQFSQLEKLVVDGHHQQCQEQLDLISVQQIPRDLAWQFAQLASRIQHSIYALKVLYRYIYPKNSFDEPARDSEKMVYAYALTNLGAAQEALDLLETVDSEKNPEVYFQKSVAYVKQWDYAKSIPMLKEFIANDSVPPYRKLVAEVNLAAAYICQFDFLKAEQLLFKIQKNCLENNYNLLLGNSFELMAQNYFFQKRYDQALECLEKSFQYLKDQKGIYLFFVEKWKVICNCFQSPSAENLKALQSLRQQSVEKMFWDTTREFDLFEGILKNDEQIVRKVVLGTPSQPYQQRIHQLFGKITWPRGDYKLLLAGATVDCDLVFNPFEISKSSESLSEKPQLLALYQALTLDFYRPHYIGAIFKFVYPDERFNPTTSPQRVMRLLERLDSWFKENGWPLAIHFKKSEFALQSNQPIAVVIQRGKTISVEEIKWSAVKEQFQDRTFTVTKLMAVLNLSKSTAVRLLTQALEDGLISKSGVGRSTQYRFRSRSKRDKAAS